MQYSDKTKEKCPDLTYGRCVDLGRSRLAVNELIVGEFSVEDFARQNVALYIITVLTAGTPGVSKIVPTFRSKTKNFQITLLSVTPEYCVLSFSFRPLRPTRAFGHFFLLLTTNIYIVA